MTTTCWMLVGVWTSISLTKHPLQPTPSPPHSTHGVCLFPRTSGWNLPPNQTRPYPSPKHKTQPRQAEISGWAVRNPGNNMTFQQLCWRKKWGMVGDRLNRQRPYYKKSPVATGLFTTRGTYNYPAIVKYWLFWYNHRDRDLRHLLFF